MAATTRPVVRAVLLDIEGTVCPITFVKDVLFPYALNALPETLETKWDDPNFAKYRDAFPPEYRSSKDELAAHVRDLMNKDEKISYLKSLQGFIWERGYASGELRAPLFPDVAGKLMAWHQKGLEIMIYSSGSVAAQQLLFRHTNAEHSDLSSLISDWFDTVNAGPKTETKSYRTIAKAHSEIAIDHWLFLSDNPKEVDAAVGAGMQSMVVQRPGNAPLPDEVSRRHQIIENFDVIAENS
ncbi:enolase-phosphatase E1 [Xylariaceae sp. FL1019]|nr:enolase-phosphatase E1 [Xylariaceae sp. FL1019]